MKRACLTIVVAGLGIAGCDLKPPAAAPAPPAAQAVAPPVPAMPTVTTPISDLVAPTAQEDVERVVAKRGVGIKGRSLDQHEGIVVTPAKSLFAVKERAVFEIAIPHAMNLYQASNGQGPQSDDEFMQQIIAANNIKLPALPPGHRYVFDPETQQLMVERPKQAATAPAAPK